MPYHTTNPSIDCDLPRRIIALHYQLLHHVTAKLASQLLIRLKTTCQDFTNQPPIHTEYR